MTLEYVKEIKDPLHGFIRVTQIEIDIIDTPVFQRLQNIKQLGFAYLIYPSARHTRFEHSIGVMDIAGKMMEKMINNQNEWIDDCESYFNMSKEFLLPTNFQSKTKIRQLLIQIARLGGLLHDVGHLCYSHTFEQGLEPLFSNPNLSTLNELEDLRKRDVDYQKLPDAKFHEYVSHIIIKEIIPDLINHQFPKWIFNFIYQLLEADKHSEILSIFDPIRKLIDGPLDADRLDYVSRDALASGIKLGAFDLQRVINNTRVYKIADRYELRFSTQTSDNIAAFMIFRQNLYRSLYHHRMVSLYDEIMAILIQILVVSNTYSIPIKKLLIDRMLHGELNAIYPDQTGKIDAKYLHDYTGEKILITEPSLSFTDEIWMATLSNFIGEISSSWKTDYHEDIGDWSGFVTSTALISDPKLLFKSFSNRKLKPIALWKDYKGFIDNFLLPIQKNISNFLKTNAIKIVPDENGIITDLLKHFNENVNPNHQLEEFLTSKFIQYTIKQTQTQLTDQFSLALKDFMLHIQGSGIQPPKNMIMVIKKPPYYKDNIKFIDETTQDQLDLSELNPVTASMKDIIQSKPLFYIFIQDPQINSNEDIEKLKTQLKQYFSDWISNELIETFIELKLYTDKN